MALHTQARQLAGYQLNRNSASCQASASDRRIPDKQTLIEEVAAWEKDRNKKHTKADWQFTTAVPASS